MYRDFIPLHEAAFKTQKRYNFEGQVQFQILTNSEKFKILKQKIGESATVINYNRSDYM